MVNLDKFFPRREEGLLDLIDIGELKDIRANDIRDYNDPLYELLKSNKGSDASDMHGIGSAW